MKQTTLYTLILFLLVSCQQEDSAILSAKKGYLSLSSIEIQAEEHSTALLTRTVDADFTVEIMAEESTVHKYEAGDAALSKKIELDAGEYTLKVYSANYGSESTWENTDLGEPIYYCETPFTIEESLTTPIDVKVPMANFGVRLSLPEGFATWIKAYTFTVTYGERSITLTNGETAYFGLPTADMPLKYSLSVTNVEDETFSSTEIEYTPEGGKIYVVSYSSDTGLSTL